MQARSKFHFICVPHFLQEYRGLCSAVQEWSQKKKKLQGRSIVGGGESKGGGKKGEEAEIAFTFWFLQKCGPQARRTTNSPGTRSPSSPRAQATFLFPLPGGGDPGQTWPAATPQVLERLESLGSARGTQQATSPRAPGRSRRARRVAISPQPRRPPPSPARAPHTCPASAATGALSPRGETALGAAGTRNVGRGTPSGLRGRRTR